MTRDVALKVLRPGMETKQVVARFAAELQAQARMSHEHVADPSGFERANYMKALTNYAPDWA